MAKQILFDEFKKIIDNEDYDESFKSLLQLTFVTALRINEIATLIKLARVRDSEVIEFLGKKGSEIKQPMTLDIKELISKIKNNWSNGESISKSIQRWNKKYNLSIELHSIRRLAATVVDDNLDIRHAQALLGHKSTETTQIYIDKLNTYKKKNYSQQVLSEVMTSGNNELVTMDSLKRENQELKRRLKIYEDRYGKK